MPSKSINPAPATMTCQNHPCTDFTTMCEYCWTKFEACEKHPGHESLACTNLGTMCDFCWRAYETSGVGETVIPEDDNCLDPTTMCDSCRNVFNTFKRHIPEDKLLASPGTYPVYFFRRFDEHTKHENDEISRAIKAHLQGHFGDKVSAHAVVVTPRGESLYAGAAVLVDFPHYVSIDVRLLKQIFGGLPEGDRKWAFRVPRREQCLSEFRMTWWKTMWECSGK